MINVWWWWYHCFKPSEPLMSIFFCLNLLMQWIDLFKLRILFSIQFKTKNPTLQISLLIFTCEKKINTNWSIDLHAKSIETKTKNKTKKIWNQVSCHLSKLWLIILEWKISKKNKNFSGKNSGIIQMVMLGDVYHLRLLCVRVA